MSEFHSIDEVMHAAALSGVEFAQDCGITLDYSESSIEKVENLAGGLHDSMTIDRPDNKEVERVYTMLGAYIAEVIKRRWGGQWKMDSTLYPGEKILTFSASGIEMWPHEKVYKRLTNGEDDNLVWYFQVLKEMISRKA